MDITEAIAAIEENLGDPRGGLPEELFLFASSITAMVNVDLLIKDEAGRTLLAWRDDMYCGAGWHVPGGIIRFKERLHERLEKVALTEIGTEVEYDPAPLVINELFIKPRVRGHFISFLYRCSLPASFVPPNRGLAPTDPGFLRWHDGCPDDLLSVHEQYRGYIDGREVPR